MTLVPLMDSIAGFLHEWKSMVPFAELVVQCLWLEDFRSQRMKLTSLRTKTKKEKSDRAGTVLFGDYAWKLPARSSLHVRRFGIR